MSLDVKNLTPQERYQLVGKLIEEIKLRKLRIFSNPAKANPQ